MVNKVVTVDLGLPGALLRFAHVVVPSLAHSEVDGVLSGMEVHLGGLHVVTRRSIANGGVLPLVGSRDDVPVESPALLLLATTLSAGRAHLVDLNCSVLEFLGRTAHLAGLHTEGVLVDMELIGGGERVVLDIARLRTVEHRTTRSSKTREEAGLLGRSTSEHHHCLDLGRVG